ncbi:MAG TPA: NAD-dependent epimerase/dehydratase family protein [Candidatus Binatia bacterium]|nr:NAD-dependent epimerase/dehydratase family protein [Candidatus Binatia bacterium]
MIEDRQILITGGAGFIGTALAERLVAHNQVVLFDCRFDGMPFVFSPLPHHPHVQPVQGDVRDYERLAPHVEKAQVIIHLAALVGVRNVLRHSRETIEVITLGTSNVLRAAEHNGGLERLMYLSTSEVFGASSFRAHETSHPTLGPVSEARWTYSIAKLVGEHLAQSYNGDAGLPTVIIRPFNIFGPRRLGDHAMLRFIVNALRGRDLEVHGDGSQIRSWCYIDDFCDGVLAALARAEAIGQDFNLGSAQNTVTIYDLARRVIRISGSSSRIRFVEASFTDIDLRVPLLDKARRLLGYNPTFDLDDAIGLTLAWYRDHLDVVASGLDG